MRRRVLILTLTVLLVPYAATLAEEPAPTQRKNWKVRWVLLKYQQRELEKNPDAWPDMQRRVRRAAKAGYNGIVFTDRNEYWYQGENTALWRRRLGELGRLTRSLGMQFLVTCVPAKGGGTTEMAESFPVKDAPLVVRDGVLVPIRTAQIRNGSFEQFEGNTPTGFGLPEAGKHAFIDRENEAHDGKASIRVDNFEEVGGRSAMPVQTVAVKPFHQYRVSFWLKVGAASTPRVRVMAYVPGDGDQERDICKQEPRIRPRTPRNEWIKVQATFNSWDHTKVRLLFGPINWRKSNPKGTHWLDDAVIEDVPFLNVNRRAELPNKVVGENGRVYVEGRDYARIEDPLTGLAWGADKPGHYGVKQAHPAIRVLPGSALREGQRLRYTGYHIALEGKHWGKTPSMTSDLVFDMYADQVRVLRRAANPDGYLIWFDEMRTGGWEPKALRYETCGQMVNAALRRTYNIVMREGGGKPVHCWHDMFSPYRNARANYYLMRNTLEGAGKDLPKGLRIWVWGGGNKGAEETAFFAKQGLRQIICTYYDNPNIEKQYQRWMTELDKSGAKVDGVVYSSWGSKRGDGFEDLEKFAEVWWGGGER